ncbi:hypothetical protein Q3G72_004300 [Acer saccharum]|nr:hypothetical protein Q3G72_004300 [Acer saccharum]
MPWLIIPYVRNNEEDSFSSAEKEFNVVHSHAMGLVDTAFVRIKSRWQLLGRRWKEECIEFLPFVIVIGCLLHNFLIKFSEPMPDDDLGCLKEEEFSIFEGEVDETGRGIRDFLAEHLSRSSTCMLESFPGESRLYIIGLIDCIDSGLGEVGRLRHLHSWCPQVFLCCLVHGMLTEILYRLSAFVSVPPFVFVFFIAVIADDDDTIGVVVDEWSTAPSNADNGKASLLTKQ